MKTMNDFKGTQGDFVAFRQDDDIYIETKERVEAIASIMGGKGSIEDEANAKLFIASKRLLEAILEAHSFVSESLAYQAAQSGASSVQILEHVKNNPIRIKLEQAINEAL